MIDLGRIIKTDKLEWDDKGNLVVIYRQRLEFMDQQTWQGSNSSVPAPIYSSTSAPTLIYSFIQRSASGQPSRTSYNEYGNEREDFKPRGKCMPLEQ